MYEIVMPQLSDSMDEGKLISWKVSVGDSVKSGDVIAEVESDKAIMELQSFKDGVVKELLAKEGDVISVGSVIARIETDKSTTQAEKKVEPIKQQEKQTPVKELQITPKEEPKPSKKIAHAKGLSPKARAKAAAYGIDTKVLTQHLQKEQIHTADIQEYITEHYFTPKAKQLLQKYRLEASLFRLDHKIDADEVERYIVANEIALPKELSSMQKAIIANVENAAKKPVFHIYEHIDATQLIEAKEYTVTAWFIKIIADVMMRHDAFRSSLEDGYMFVAPHASLSVAVAYENELYMPVIKAANRLSIKEIAQKLQEFQNKAKTKAFSPKEMDGSSFGISNLGMLGIERFDAMINKNDAAMAAVGALLDDKIALTLSIDHRLINGYEAALFVKDLKEAFLDPLNFKQ